MIRLVRLFALYLVFVGLVASSFAACREPKTVHESIANLRHPEWKERRRAADELRTDAGVPAEAVPHLLAAAQVEQNGPALGAMLITLGKSGVPEAKPIIDQHIPSPDKDMRRWVSKALRYWMTANGQLPPDVDLPSGWPYGQPGYPPPLYDD